jgi:hypothetical protein
MKIDIAQLAFIEDTLRVMAMAVETRFGVEFTVTSLYRIGDDGVHGQLPLRGIDLRCRDTAFGCQVVDWVNARWQYDPSRPQKECAMYHDIGQGAHIHLQVHPNTRSV